MMLGVAVSAPAQTPIDTIAPESRRVEGTVQLGRRSGPVPVAGTWVVVHRIGRDRSGPLDSARTSRSGVYRIGYRASGDASAMYIAVTSYAGIAYITTPLRLPRVTGDDAAIMVFDTTAPPFPIRVAGRHFVVTGPGEDGSRRVIEVYELMNDSTLTVVGSEAKPVWSAPIPPGARDFQLSPVGDLTPGTVRQVADRLDVFVPISPGIRQLTFGYTLPPSAFPLTVPLADSVEVLEVLVQEPDATVDGAGLTEVAPVIQYGQTYRRLVAQTAKRNTVIRLTMPAVTGGLVARSLSIIGSVLAGTMLLALPFALWRRRRTWATAPAEIDPIDAMTRDLAALDVDFERRGAPTDADRAKRDSERSVLKARLTAALAARERRP